jgi:hypothetical protein
MMCVLRTGLSDNGLLQIEHLRPLRAPLGQECVNTIIEVDILPNYNRATSDLRMPAESNVSKDAQDRLLFDAHFLHTPVLRSILQRATGAEGLVDVLKAVEYDLHDVSKQRRLLRELCVLFALGTLSLIATTKMKVR